MYPYLEDTIKGTIKDYLELNQFHNTRTKLLTETRLEIDKLEFEKAVALICEVCLSLVRKNFHFAVFYAEGQRSPHVVIYDFEELEELTPFQRIRAQVKFWRTHVPFGLFSYVDTGVFDDEHYVPLEFAPHWKYKTIFNLMFEWLPEQEEIIEKPTVRIYKKRIISRPICKKHNFELIKTTTDNLICGCCFVEEKCRN